MAEKKVALTYDAVMRQLKSGIYKPIYILMGDEPYFIDKISDYIADNVLQPDEQFFNQDVVYGPDVNVARVVELAKGYPIMPATRRVVIVKEAQAMKQIEQLEQYLTKPAETTILVLCYKNGTINGRSKLVTKANALGVVLECKKKRENELPAFIESYLKTQHAAIDPKAAAMIADHIGSDLHRLVSELDKVLIAQPNDNRRVTPEIVERQIGVNKDFNAFELKNAIVQKDVYKANQIVNYFDKNPKAGSIYSFLPLLFSYFQNLMMAFYAPNRASEQAVAAQLDLKSPWAARDYMTGMRNYTAMKTLLIIDKIREIDAKSKGIDNVHTSPGDLMRELLFFILH